MSLRPDRRIIDEDGSFFFNPSSTATRGGVCSLVTVGSGSAMDDGAALVDYVANPSGITPVGVLIQDVVNDDLTQQKQNYLRDEVQANGKVSLVTKGTFVTDHIYPGQTITAGQNAYVVHSGYLSNSDSIVTDHSTSKRRVGTFLSSKDEEGFAKVTINIP